VLSQADLTPNKIIHTWEVVDFNPRFYPRDDFVELIVVNPIHIAILEDIIRLVVIAVHEQPPLLLPTSAHNIVFTMQYAKTWFYYTWCSGPRL
jgi:hypothetical protein